MSYQVLCTFDLKSATSTDYLNAYADLLRLGLSKVHKGSNGDVAIPTTTVLGDFTGSDAKSVAQYVRDQVATKFKARGFSSEIFVVAGLNGTWASHKS